jgi:hypothetical protein
MTKNLFSKLPLLFTLVCLLGSCTSAPLPTATPTPSKTPSPAPTETPLPTATPTPIVFDIEQLGTMTNEQKLTIAPQPETAPDNIVSSFLPNLTAKDITWGEKSLSFWDRVVTYQGTTKTGESITLYYDLESGQWAKKYADYSQVSQIPGDQIPDVMFVGDRLIRNKLEYPYDWISQPQVMTTDGKMIFRDDKGYPKAVWDTVNSKWMTPEEADVVWTFEKFKSVSDVPFIGGSGKELNYNYLFDPSWSDYLTDPNQIENLPNGTFIMVLNPSGEITVWTSQKEAANRAREGATIIVGKGETQTEKNENFDRIDIATWKIAFDQYKKGNKSLFVVYGDVGVKTTQIQGRHSIGVGYDVIDLPQVVDNKTGKVVCPVIRLPKHATATYGIGNPSQPLNDPIYWLDFLIQSGATKIIISAME